MERAIRSTIYGLAGCNPEITECYADIEIETYNSAVGGLYYLTYNSSKISDNYVRGSVHYGKNGSFGSLAVRFSTDSFEKCYGAVEVVWDAIPVGSSSEFGGAYAMGSTPASPLYYNTALVSKAFDTLSTQDAERAYSRGTGLTTVEMKKMASYEDFDFDNVWGRRNDINDGYPYLRWTAPGLENDPDAEGTVESITFPQDNLTIKVKETKKLEVEVVPADALQTLVWESSNTDVVKVSDDGEVTGITEGTATITASATDGSGVTALCVITVSGEVGIEGILSDTGHEVTVLSLQGQLLFKGDMADACLPKGIYIIRTSEGQTFKVNIR